MRCDWGGCTLQPIWKVDADLRRAACGQTPPGAATVFDFDAAFPSLGHEYLWSVLRGSGMLAQVTCAIRSLYAETRQRLKRQPWTESSLCVTSGARQGCPLSPVLFLLAIAPAIDVLASAIAPDDLMAMLADDLALALRPLWRTLLALPPTLAQVRLHTGLRLQVNECKTVPLWSLWHELSFRRPWVEVVRTWARFDVGDDARYRGIVLGPGSFRKMRLTVDAK